MTAQEPLPAKFTLPPSTRDYAKCGWIFAGLAAFFSIAPAKEIAFIVLGLFLGAIFSFLAYAASRFQRIRLAGALFLFGLLNAAFFILSASTINERMMTEITRRHEGKAR